MSLAINRLSVAVVLVALAGVGVGVRTAVASNYPPSYSLCYDKVYLEEGSFDAIKVSRTPYKSQTELTVSYNGPLVAEFGADAIQFRIDLNGQEVVVPARQGSYGEAYVLLHSYLHDCQHCAPQNSGTPGTLCHDHIANGGSMYTWACVQPSAVEKQLFAAAFNQGGLQVPWNLEVSAEVGWRVDDNDGGGFHFEPVTTCGSAG